MDERTVADVCGLCFRIREYFLIKHSTHTHIHEGTDRLVFVKRIRWNEKTPTKSMQIAAYGLVCV